MRCLRTLGLGAVALVSVIGTSANALVSIGVSDNAAPYNAPATFDFNTPTPEWGGSIFNDNATNQRARPGGSDGGYASVGPIAGSGGNDKTLDLSGFGVIEEISLLWGSVDQYNFLDIMSGGNVLQTISGSQIASGSGGPRPDKIVSLALSGSDQLDVTGLRFRSTSPAFEFDNVNVTVSAVPEPATWAMMLLGFGLVGAGMRSRKRTMVLA